LICVRIIYPYTKKCLFPTQSYVYLILCIFLLGQDTESGLTLGAKRARGGKCDRCWFYSDTVGADEEDIHKVYIYTYKYLINQSYFKVSINELYSCMVYIYVYICTYIYRCWFYSDTIGADQKDIHKVCVCVYVSVCVCMGVCIYIYVCCWFYSDTVGADEEDIHKMWYAFLVLAPLLAGSCLTYGTDIYIYTFIGWFVFDI
jgi:hypothetical protein